MPGLRTDVRSRSRMRIRMTHSGLSGVCIPPVDKDNPEVRLIRAILGACPDCDLFELHAHDAEEHDPGAFTLAIENGVNVVIVSSKPKDKLEMENDN